jgi:prolycopene isomerase
VDVAVVGAGLGGLTCALDLARHGFKVCVFEQHRVAGGYAHSFVRKGYHFDVSLHYLGGLAPGGITHGIMQSLGILDRINVRKRETVFSAEFPDFDITLPNDIDGIREELLRCFPDERQGLASLFEFLGRYKHDVIGPTVVPGYDADGEGRLTDEYAAHTFADVLGSHVSDPQLLALLGQLWMYVGLPPSMANAAYSTCVFCSAFMEGSFDVLGGGAALVRAMVDRLRELGGECFVRAPVAKIMVEDESVAGVELESGEQIAARIVVSNANPYQTFFELVPEDAVSRIYRYRLEQMDPSLSAYSVYLGLDCPPEQVGVPMDNFFMNYAADCDDAFRRAMAGEVHHTDWCSTRYEHTQQAMFPKGAGVVALAELAPSDGWLDISKETYAERKAEVEERLLAKYERRFPGLRDHIVVSEFATPRTMRRFTRNHNGSVYGLSQTVAQSGRKRLRNRSPISGLYLTGAWTWSGGGYEGTIMTGVQTSQSVFQEFEAPRPTGQVRLHPEGDVPIKDPLAPARPLGIEPTAPSSDEHYRYRHQVMVFGDDMNSRQFVEVSAYFRFMDRGRVEAIEEICRGVDRESWLDRYMVNVYRVEARCVTAAGIADRLEVRTGIRKTTSHRAAFDQRIVNATSGELLVDAVVEVLFLDPERQLVPVPDELPVDDFGGPNLDDVGHPPAPFGEEQRFPFRTPFRVYYEDTDAQGITYHVAYVRFCERALFNLVRTVWPEMSTPTWIRTSRAGVSRFDIRYLNASGLGDRLEVSTGPLGATSHRLLFGQRVLSAGDGKVVADAVTEVEFRDEQERPVPIPQMVIEAAREFLPPDRLGDGSRGS